MCIQIPIVALKELMFEGIPVYIVSQRPGVMVMGNCVMEATQHFLFPINSFSYCNPVCWVLNILWHEWEGSTVQSWQYWPDHSNASIP